MIVDTMTDEEIAKICKREYEDEVFESIHKVIDSNRYTRFINKNLKAEQKYHFKNLKYTTKSGNVFYTMLDTKGKREFKTKGILFSSFMVYRKNNSLHAMLHSRIYELFSESADMEREYIDCIFTPHFFDRYQERCLKNNEMTRMEVILKFLETNSKGMKRMPISNPKYKNNIYFVTKEGIILGEGINHWLAKCKTFIPNDMLKNDQTEDINFSLSLKYMDYDL